MSFRCYDPHYKPDRSPSKYQSKNKLDALSCADAASFVAEFLANYKSDKSEKQNPCGVFMALRIEERRLRKSNQRSAPLTAIRARTQQKRLDRSVRRAVKRCRHPRRHPPIASATAMHMTVIRTQTERKRQDRSVRHAEKRRCRAGTLRVHGPIRPTSGVCAIAETAQGEKRLFNWQNQAMLTSDGRPLGIKLDRASDGQEKEY